MDYVRNNKFKTFIYCFITAYVVTLPFTRYFETDLSAKNRARQRALGNKKFLEDDEK